MTRTVTLVRHHVSDFDAWKSQYDIAAPLQKASGVRAHQVLRSDADANDVVVSHTFDSSDAAHAFMANTEVKDAMKRAGVDTDSITTMYYDEVETASIA